jgi:hypothetical protein
MNETGPWQAYILLLGPWPGPKSPMLRTIGLPFSGLELEVSVMFTLASVDIQSFKISLALSLSLF